MLRVEITESKTNQRSFVSFFDDDSIDTVRQKIGRVLEVHPDRLFILAKVERPKDYYSKNPHKWESLFNRLSFTESSIQRVPFSEYQTFYRSPATSIIFEEISRSEWMEVPDSVKELHSPATSFTEYMILGVKEELSFILPRKFDSALSFKIPASSFPIPDISALVSDLRGFYCIEYDEEAEQVQPIYFPLLRPNTPSRMGDDEVNLLVKNEEKIKKLLALKSPEPTAISIVRTRFHIPWIETDFGSVIRSRFEQMFYGLTVSKNIPCITFFTSNTEVSRHKFYVEDTKTKSPFLDLVKWNSWWNNTKPSRNRPTLVLYRGASNKSFDRISITAVDMVISTYRPDGNTETQEELKKSVYDWLLTFDSIIPFIVENDLDEERWELQDMSFIATYSKTLEEYDLRRFSCITSVFDVADIDKSLFRFLRTDYSVQGVSAVEMKILQLLRDNLELNVNDIAKELSVPNDKAREILRQVELKRVEDPNILEKAFRGFPTMQLGPKTILLSSTNRLEKSLEYANILRYILSTPDAKDLDEVCPKRMERVEAKAVKVEEEVFDQAILDEYMDLVSDIDIEADSKAIEEEEQVEEEELNEKIIVKQERKTLYNYFNSRLQKFDSKTYNTNNPDYEYPKKCEQKHQPIILSNSDLERVKGTPYDPIEYIDESQYMNVEEPNGLVICPEYWCIRDEIPLKETQLVDEDGFQRCPMCKGRVKDKLNQNPQEYTVISRDKAFKFPRLTKYKSPTNGKRMPCCYKKPEVGNKSVIVEDKFYILGDTKVSVPELRISFVSKKVLDSIQISETYETFAKQPRIHSAMSGVFRIGLGRPSKTLPLLLNLKVKVPRPRESPHNVMKCSFFNTWTHFSDDYEDINEETESEELSKRIAGIDLAYERQELSIIQELEYVAISLNCDIFRIVNVSMECFFETRLNQSRKRAIIVLQDGDIFTVVSFVSRTGNSLTYQSNVYEKPFEKKTYIGLETIRNMSCNTSIPSYDNALSSIQEILPTLQSSSYSIILDPYVRGQAIYIPSKLVLPFKATPLPDTNSPKINGFENANELPKHADVLSYLEIAKKYSSGYVWAEDMYNSKNERVEIRLKSGLRIPVIPELNNSEEPTEVIQSVNMKGERKMTFSNSDESLKETYSEISYASEIFEFLIFELSKTLNDNHELQSILSKNPSRIQLEPALKKWYEANTDFDNLTNPTDFISKIRTPCGQFKSKKACTGNVCGWDGKTCRIQVKKSVRKNMLFHRLLSTLVENAKIRSIILDGRATPFFSTILYMELPHELILTDIEIKI